MRAFLGTTGVWHFATRVEQRRRLATVLLDYRIYVLARTCLSRGSRVAFIFSNPFYFFLRHF